MGKLQPDDADWRPARGGGPSGSWPPFTPGNMAHLMHGAVSRRSVGPLADVLERQLAVAAPWTQAAAFAGSVRSWSWTEGQAALLRSWLDQHGVLDERGEPRAAASMLHRVESRLIKLRARLGLDPRSLATLLRDAASVARATGDEAVLDALEREGRAILEARAQQALTDGGDVEAVGSVDESSSAGVDEPDVIVDVDEWLARRGEIPAEVEF